MGGRKSLGSRLKDCSVNDGNNNETVLGDQGVSDPTASRVLAPLNNFSNTNDSSDFKGEDPSHSIIARNEPKAST